MHPFYLHASCLSSRILVLLALLQQIILSYNAAFHVVPDCVVCNLTQAWKIFFARTGRPLGAGCSVLPAFMSSLPATTQLCHGSLKPPCVPALPLSTCHTCPYSATSTSILMYYYPGVLYFATLIATATSCPAARHYSLIPTSLPSITGHALAARVTAFVLWLVWRWITS